MEILNKSNDYDSEVDSTQSVRKAGIENIKVILFPFISSIPGVSIFLSVLGFIIWKSNRRLSDDK